MSIGNQLSGGQCALRCARGATLRLPAATLPKEQSVVRGCVVVGREPEAVAELRRALGERLATYRKLRNLTQDQLARRVHHDRTTVVRAESGQRGKDSAFWGRVDRELGAEGVLLAAFDKLEQAKAEHARQSRAAELAAQQRMVERWRRQAEQPSGPGAADDFPGSARTTAADLAAIQAMASAFQMADRQVGGGHLYRTVWGYLRSEVSPRLVEPAPGPVGVDLFAAAASLTELAGWMAHDDGRDDQARQHLGQAYRLASTAGRPALAANVCASMSHLAGQLGKARDAVRIAEVGLQHARRGPARARLTARLHVMRARGLAMQGDRGACLTALNRSERALALVPNDEPARWVSPFDEGSLAGEAALCWRQLGELAEAQRQALRVLELRAADHVRSRAFGQITLARVLVDAGHVEDAAALGREVCATAGSLTSARVLSRLSGLDKALRPYGSLPEVGAFQAECSSLRSDQVVTDEGAAWPV